ncbi:MAG: helicase-associated domain-containing protein [Thermomicrobiales bacterium]
MKRSLLTLLMDTPPADIQAAAESWDVRLTKRTHADNVALLYQAMTDRWTIEDVLDGLPAQARDLAGLLALDPGDGLAREELMTRTGFDPLDLNAALAVLRRFAILHRQSTGILYLPREIASLIARSIRDRQHGEAQTPTINQLLEHADGDVLLGAARLWHVADTPASLRPGDRERLVHALHSRARTPRALTDVEAALSPGARRVVAALREEEGPLPLDDAASLAGADRLIDRRALLAELTESLLVWHGWASGERVLLMPAEFRTPAMEQLPLPPLAAVSAEPLHGWRHPYALAWDTLTFLRLVESQPARWPSGGLAALADDHAFAERVAPRFWTTGDGAIPPSASLAFLGTLARARGLLTERDEEGRRIIALSDPVAWAKVGFAPQTKELFTAWRGLAGWVEGQGTAIQLWGVDWPAFRGRLLDALAACQPGHWYMVDNLLARLARVRPPLLGEEFTAASAVGQTTPDRAALTRTCIDATLRTALTWFGIVTWGNAAMGEAVQLTDVGWWLLGRGREPVISPFGATPLAIQPDLTVLVLNGEPSHLWPLLALAEAETLDRVSAYRITATSLRGALRRGLAFDQVIRFLESRTGGPLPDAVRVTLDDWVRAVRRVVLEAAVILSADDAESLAEAVALARTHGATVAMLPDGRAIVRVPNGDEELTAWLKEADLTPVWKPTAAFANRPG